MHSENEQITRVTGYWRNFVDYLLFWKTIIYSVTTRISDFARWPPGRTHFIPMDSLQLLLVLLKLFSANFVFLRIKRCVKKRAKQNHPPAPNNNSTNRKVTIIVMPFLCKMKSKHAMENCILELSTFTTTVTFSRMGWVCPLFKQKTQQKTCWIRNCIGLVCN